MSVHELLSRPSSEQQGMLERLEELREQILANEIHSLILCATTSHATFCATSFGPDKLGILGSVTILQQQLASDFA